MSFLNPVDVVSYMDSFDTDKAVNARNRADAFTKASAAKRSGAMASKAAQMFGEAKDTDLKIDAGLYAQQQMQNASTFGSIMGVAGGIGSMGVQGMFDPTKVFHNNALFGQTPFGAGGGTLPDVFGKSVGTFGPNYGIRQ